MGDGQRLAGGRRRWHRRHGLRPHAPRAVLASGRRGRRLRRALRRHASPRSRSGSGSAGGSRCWSNVGERAAGGGGVPRGRDVPRARVPGDRRVPARAVGGRRRARTPGSRPPTAPRCPAGARPGTAISGWPHCAAAAAAAAWSPRSCCTGGPGASCMWPGPPVRRSSTAGDADFATVLAAVIAAGHRADRTAGGGPPAGVHRPADRAGQPARGRRAAGRGRGAAPRRRHGGQPGRVRSERAQAGQRHPRPRGGRPAAGTFRLGALAVRGDAAGRAGGAAGRRRVLSAGGGPARRRGGAGGRRNCAAGPPSWSSARAWPAASPPPAIPSARPVGPPALPAGGRRAVPGQGRPVRASRWWRAGTGRCSGWRMRRPRAVTGGGYWSAAVGGCRSAGPVPDGPERAARRPRAIRR